MKFAHLITRATQSPWFITPDALSGIRDMIEARLAHGARLEMPMATPPDDDDEEDSPRGYAVVSGGGVALIKAHGILGHHLSLMERVCGGVDYGALANSIAQAMADPAVGSVVLHLNSPGGMASGCAETFARIRSIKAESGKPLLCFVDGVCASAALYLAAACDKIFCTETAELGCVGSILKLQERTEKNAKEGVKYIVIKSARLKDIGNPDRPMTDEERGILEERIDYLGGLFVRDLQLGREGKVAAEVTETGLTWYGPQAIERGLADVLVSGLDELLRSLAPTAPAI